MCVEIKDIPLKD